MTAKAPSSRARLKLNPQGKASSVWKSVRLGEIFTQSRAKGKSGLPVLSVTLDRGLVPRNTIDRRMAPSLPAEESLRVHPGDLAYNMMRMWQGAIGYCHQEGVVSPAYVVCRPDPKKVDARFMLSVFKSHRGLHRLRCFSHGITDDRLRLYFEDFAKIRVRIPPITEQRKIADILTTWDRALDKLNALIETYERRKKILMQELLTGHRRLKGFGKSKGKTISDRFGIYPADWRRVSLGEVTREVATRNAEGTNLPVLSCSKHRGLVLSEEYFGKRVYSQDTSGYRVVKRGEFAYATNHIEEGSIGYQNLCEIGLVSPIYTVFKTTEAVDDSYLFRVLKSPLLIHLYQINTRSSVDRRGSLRYDDFSRIPIWLPAKEEQAAIAQVFGSADKQLALFRAQHDAIDHQRRGLVQRLLTGKLRVLK